jgi:predicted transporter
MMTPYQRASVSLAVATIAIVMWIALVVAIFYYKPFHDLVGDRAHRAITATLSTASLLLFAWDHFRKKKGRKP